MFVDLQNEVGRLGIQDQSLQKLYANIFHEKISKRQRLTNWEASELTIHQQEYAALDALACIKIYDYLQATPFVAEKSKYYRLISNPSLNNPPAHD